MHVGFLCSKPVPHVVGHVQRKYLVILAGASTKRRNQRVLTPLSPGVQLWPLAILHAPRAAGSGGWSDLSFVNDMEPYRAAWTRGTGRSRMTCAKEWASASATAIQLEILHHSAAFMWVSTRGHQLPPPKIFATLPFSCLTADGSPTAEFQQWTKTETRLLWFDRGSSKVLLRQRSTPSFWL